MTVPSFGQRLASQFAEGRHLCVGVDPHDALLTDWALPLSAEGAERMGRIVVEAAAGSAACIKPQVAFFERFGAAGFVALERTLRDARTAGLLVIADVKRGDIGSSFGAYAEAWLAPGSPLEADAMTAVAYQGFGSVDTALDFVRDAGKGLFVLAATSNPEAREVQTARRADGRTVAGAMIDDARAWNAQHAAAGAVGSVGVVLGATLKLSEYGISHTAVLPERDADPNDAVALPVLAPGFGHQGARIEEAGSLFGSLGRALLANESRSILAGGAAGVAERIAVRSSQIAEALTAA